MFKKSFLGIAVLLFLIFNFYASSVYAQASLISIELNFKVIKDFIQTINQFLEKFNLKEKIEMKSWCYDFDTDLKFGDEGKKVEALQIALQKEGFYKKEINGYFDEYTMSAVSFFRQKYVKENLKTFELEDNSIYVDEKTREALNQRYGCKKTIASSIPSFSLLEPQFKSPLNVIAPNGGKIWKKNSKIVTTFFEADNLENIKIIKWSPPISSKAELYDTLEKPATIKVYLKNVQGEIIGRIPVFSDAVGSLKWVVGVVSKSDCLMLDEYLKANLYPNHCYNNLFLVEPGKYFIEVRNNITGEIDSSDMPFTIIDKVTVDIDFEVKKVFKGNFQEQGVFYATICNNGSNVVSDLYFSEKEKYSKLVSYVVFDKQGNKYQRYFNPFVYVWEWSIADSLKDGQCSKIVWLLPSDIFSIYKQTKKIELILDPENFINEANENNNKYTFFEQSSFNLISPNGGEILTIKIPYEIKWYQSKKEPVTIWLENSSTSLKMMIGEYVGKFGENVISWAPPKEIILANNDLVNYKICVVSVSEKDCSDKTFIIVDNTETSNWGIYRNTEYGFEIKYPPTSYVLNKIASDNLELDYLGSEADNIKNISIKILNEKFENLLKEKILFMPERFVISNKEVFYLPPGPWVDYTMYFIPLNHNRVLRISVLPLIEESIFYKILSTLKIF